MTLRHRLAFRIGLALFVGAALILWGAFEWSLALQRRHLEELVGLSADRIAETIRGATRDGMLRNDADEVHRILENIGAQRGIARLRIFNKEGRIRTSTVPAEAGTLVDIRAEQCVACHREGHTLERLERPDRVRIFRSPSGGRILGVVAPIHNEPACHGCHRASQSVLGVLDVQLSMASVDEALGASERQMAAGLVATGLAVLLLAALLLWRMVLAPVGQLTGAIERATAGDLGASVPVGSRDELGRLAGSWNQMTAELRRARGELEEWNRTLERRVQEKTDELKTTHERLLMVEKMASLGQLAAVVAHELNNPLGGIRTYARLLRRQRREGEDETGRILEVIEGEAARCGDIVRNLLVFGRSSGGPFAAEDVGAILERCRLLLRHQAELSSLNLEVHVSEGLGEVVCDGPQVQQMALALALNALEATPAGGTVTLAGRAAEDGEGIVLEVRDTGNGIAEEHLPRIFEPFFTTKPAGKGVGLGLSVVYGIVHRHGGEVAVRSKPGAGTTFTVRLPRRPKERASPEEERRVSP
jgi:two-component system NtrC family sensor kinase